MERRRRFEEAKVQAELNGSIKTSLGNIESVLSAIWKEINEGKKDVRDLYFQVGKIGGVSGAVAGAITALAFKLIFGG